ncbi:MAG: Asp-tRNA(Asn)/Glu-tRNA(Gln) amidotransferase GatCAB subunit B, partial [Nitrospinaceae bacterium]|nr:Asp-tRNA(Asn)/Glu-tRNA(Gln) amidotransferase GatCAB subunit B [Nitrospinaceae bacterium]
AKQIFSDVVDSGKTADEIIEEKGLKQVSDAGELEGIVEKVIQENPEEYERYKQGNP